MERPLVLLLLLTPALWLISLLLLARWRYFRPFFIVNLLVLCAYASVFTCTSWVHYGHDEYGLGRIVLLALASMVHVLVGFTVAVAFYFRRRALDS
jgi:hypothetical protein